MRVIGEHVCFLHILLLPSVYSCYSSQRKLSKLFLLHECRDERTSFIYCFLSLLACLVRDCIIDRLVPALLLC